MKGVVFNIFEDFIIKNFGDEAWELVLNESGTNQDVFVGPKTYPDSVFLKLVTTAVELKNLNLGNAVRLFGKFTYPQLVKKMPDVVKDFNTPEELLEALDGIIHVEVRKLLEEANPPKFEVSRDGDYLKMKYISERKLCTFVEGLLEGLAESYDKKVEYEQINCVHNNDESCVFKLRFIEK